ncbi:hypothetical protein QA648_17855 [Rhizobium sp. CB3171]|uniref:hypothetical protein n=1 Tax=Rhizobium sp. CB3171 TaxID=3039157 RepID=UPI0024B1B46B|nr:hypothetical protein [Rhizobium sp. CB3171]WFU01942.1 hypothetical protein QA648_17855 [Rhizobium sp. CB3171]
MQTKGMSTMKLIRPVLYAALCLTLANPPQGFSASFRAGFPPAAAPERVPVELVRHKTKRKPLPFRAEPAPGDVNLGPVVKARPGKNDRLVGRVPNSQRGTPRDNAAAKAFMGLMLGAAVGAVAGQSGGGGNSYGGHGGGNRRNGGGPSSAHHCSVDYTTPNPTSLYCR